MTWQNGNVIPLASKCLVVNLKIDCGQTEPTFGHYGATVTYACVNLSAAWTQACMKPVSHTFDAFYKMHLYQIISE